jgi:hypothetical protein
MKKILLGLLLIVLNGFTAAEETTRSSVRLIRITTPADASRYQDTPEEVSDLTGTLEKMQALNIAPEPKEKDPQEEEDMKRIAFFMQNSAGNDIYGLFGISVDDVPVGIVNLNDASEEYYSSQADVLGFDTGRFGNFNIFLKQSSTGKGLFKHIILEVRAMCDTFIGRPHRNWAMHTNALEESKEPFEGIRGIIDLTNVPSLKAFLNTGASIVDVPGVDAWVMQYPPKAEGDLNERERRLRAAANLIIEASLASFRTETTAPGEIPSTLAAQNAVHKYYYEAGLKTKATEA